MNISASDKGKHVPWVDNLMSLSLAFLFYKKIYALLGVRQSVKI